MRTLEHQVTQGNIEGKEAELGKELNMKLLLSPDSGRVHKYIT